jgi:hypothetical protein
LARPAPQLVWIADDSPGQPVRLARGLSFWSDLDAQDLALPGAEAEPLVGDVERSVRADGHAGRERQARDDRLGWTVPVDPYDRPGPRGRAPAVVLISSAYNLPPRKASPRTFSTLSRGL